MRLLVIGGTRGVGRAVVMAAHGAGHSLTVMARNAAAFEPAYGIRMVVGDAADAADMERATAGQEAVVWTVSVAPTRHDVTLFSHGTQHLLAAMRAHGVRRLLCVTGTAARAFPLRERFLPARIGRPFYRQSVALDEARQEALIHASALDWTIVQPLVLTRHGAAGRYQATTAPPGGPGKRIARADVAHYIVSHLADPEHVRKTVVLTGA
ncbi:MAG: NAD(P)H-binding protein [Betaproteobacteria bacterium]